MAAAIRSLAAAFELSCLKTGGVGRSSKHGVAGMAKDLVRLRNTVVDRRALTPAQYGDLAEVPPEIKWLANITNPKTRRAYKIDVSEFSSQAWAGPPSCAQ
jgi:hypothetical protein